MSILVEKIFIYVCQKNHKRMKKQRAHYGFSSLLLYGPNMGTLMCGWDVSNMSIGVHDIYLYTACVDIVGHYMY